MSQATRQATTTPKRKPGKTGPSQVGRDVATLLHDFGHDLPAQPPLPVHPKQPRVFHYAARRGVRRPGAGWAPATAPVSTWRMTSEQAPVLWPFISAQGLPPTGAEMGIDCQSGGRFYADPNGWVVDDMVPVTNPNVVVLGKPGQGKSGTGKAFFVRMAEFGYRTLILGDVKDEYEELCRAFGVEPFRVGIGLRARINPLALGPLGHGWEKLSREESQQRAAMVFNRWLTLIRGLVGSQHIGGQPVPCGPTETMAISTALRHLTGYGHGATVLREVTIPQLWQALDNPSEDLISACRYSTQRHFMDETRLLRDALGQLVSGSLAGLFDDHTTIDIDWAAPVQSLSLKALEPLGDEAIGIALTCLNSWGRGMREVAPAGDRRIIARDECWRQLQLGPQAVKSFDSDLRLSRDNGDTQWITGHKPSDWLAAGDSGSQAVAIAKSMLDLCDIKVLHGQDPNVANELESLLELGPIARDVVTGWARAGTGRALWCVGQQLYKVQTVLHPLEKNLAYTNQAIA